MVGSGTQRNWTREEHLAAFGLYTRLPFGQLHQHNPEIVHLAALLGRTPSAVAMKLGNFASLDPVLQQRGIRGLSQVSKGVEQLWRDFRDDPEGLAFESELEFARLCSGKATADTSSVEPTSVDEYVGSTREALVRVRVNQAFFRRRVFALYDGRCCVTGLDLTTLLVASHIIAWSVDPANRLNPRNGLCLNALHDRVFEAGLMWIDEDMRLRFGKPRELSDEQTAKTWSWISGVDGKALRLPHDIGPDPKILARHRASIGVP